MDTIRPCPPFFFPSLQTHPPKTLKIWSLIPSSSFFNKLLIYWYLPRKPNFRSHASPIRSCDYLLLLLSCCCIWLLGLGFPWWSDAIRFFGEPNRLAHKTQIRFSRVPYIGSSCCSLRSWIFFLILLLLLFSWLVPHVVLLTWDCYSSPVAITSFFSYCYYYFSPRTWVLGPEEAKRKAKNQRKERLWPLLFLEENPSVRPGRFSHRKC